MRIACCEDAKVYVMGKPGAYTLKDCPLKAINFCPWCSTKLAEIAVGRFEVTVRYNRGLGNEFKTMKVDAATLAEAKVVGEKEAGEQLAGLRFEILGSQGHPVTAG